MSIEDDKNPVKLRHLYCACGVKVAILDGSLRLRHGAVILCAECVPVQQARPSEDEVVDRLSRMFGMR